MAVSSATFALEAFALEVFKAVGGVVAAALVLLRFGALAAESCRGVLTGAALGCGVGAAFAASAEVAAVAAAAVSGSGALSAIGGGGAVCGDWLKSGVEVSGSATGAELALGRDTTARCAFTANKLAPTTPIKATPAPTTIL